MRNQGGAGQYFTPRSLIDCMVELIQPQPGELVQDPAAGTGGFLIASDRYIKQRTDDLFDLPEAQQSFQRHQAFYGIELVQDAYRLLLMNMMLHGIEGAVGLGDTLSPDGQRLAKADVILTNPPFGTKKGGGLPSRMTLLILPRISSWRFYSILIAVSSQGDALLLSYQITCCLKMGRAVKFELT